MNAIVLDGLIRLAERKECAIVITRHLSKGIGGSAIYRGMGSIDITGAARCELFVGLDPQNPDRVILAHSKSNLSRFGPSLTFSIGDGGKLDWHGESKLKANDLLALPANTSQRNAVEEAVEFLKTALAGGARPTNEIKDEAKANGISDATLRRARKSLRIVSKPSGLGEAWTMELPSVAQDFAELLKTEE